jgi:hypothetical protein
MRREHAVVGEKRVPGWGHQRCEPGRQLERRHDPVGAAAPSRFDAVRNTAIGQQAEPIETEAGPRAVAHEALAALVVVGFDPHRGLNVEPVELRGERAALLPLEAGVAVICQGGAPTVERGKRAAAKRNVGAGVEGAALRPLVAAIFCGTLVEQRVLAQPPEGAVTDAADDAIEHGLRRRPWETVELDLAGVVGREDSVREHSMEMKVEVGAEGLLDVARQAALIVLAGVGEERFEVVAHHRVQDRLRRPARSVAVPGRARSPRRIALSHRRATWRSACHMPPQCFRTLGAGNGWRPGFSPWRRQVTVS